MEMRFWESNSLGRSWYPKLQKIIEEADQHGTCIRYIEMKMFNIYPHILREAETEEEIIFLKACEQEIIGCYQRALERNYEKIKVHKERGMTADGSIETWILTLDEQRAPQKATVIGVNEKGYPIYADRCVAVEIYDDLRRVWNCRYELRRWFDEDSNSLYELKEAAKQLKEKGRLGMEEIPSANVDLGGLVGGQLDAAAWQNYVIENGMYRPTDYDQSLKTLLENIDKCIDFYEKAISMVS